VDVAKALDVVLIQPLLNSPDDVPTIMTREWTAASTTGLLQHTMNERLKARI
jgi:hypothetical protein